MTRAVRPTKADIERACKGVMMAGLVVRGVVVEGGRLEVLIGDGSNEADDESEVVRRDRQELERQLEKK